MQSDCLVNHFPVGGSIGSCIMAIGSILCVLAVGYSDRFILRVLAFGYSDWFHPMVSTNLDSDYHPQLHVGTHQI